MKHVRPSLRAFPSGIRGRLAVAATIIVAIPLLGGAVATALTIQSSLTANTLLSAQSGCTRDVGIRNDDNSNEVVELCFDTYELRQELAVSQGRRGSIVTLFPPDKDRIPGGLSLSLWPFGHAEVSADADPDEQAMARLILGSPSFVSNQRTLTVVVSSLAGGLIVLLGLFAVTIWGALGRVLRPVEGISRELAEITEHDLARRVPVPRTKDEIARLATTVNRTLERLNTAMDNNRRFAADASHELRSPIAALRAELEIAQAHPERAHWQQVVEDALGDTLRLQSLAGDLLLLTQLDATGLDLEGTVDLVLLVAGEAERPMPAHLTLVLDIPHGPLHVRGRRALLVRLLGNLLDNAERHAEHTITVRLTATGTEAVLDVTNDGSAIPVADREHIFDRFARLDDARTRDTGGTGLGLPIARRIAATHHGTLSVGDIDRGARFTARIPLGTAENPGRIHRR